MELGGNIELINFDDIEHGKLIVIKKLIGNLTKEITDKNFKNIKIELNNKEIDIKLTLKDKIKTSKESDENIFYAINKAFKKLK